MSLWCLGFRFFISMRSFTLIQAPMTNDSTLLSFVPRRILKYPSSPQSVPQELAHNCKQQVQSVKLFTLALFNHWTKDIINWFQPESIPMSFTSSQKATNWNFMHIYYQNATYWKGLVDLNAFLMSIITWQIEVIKPTQYFTGFPVGWSVPQLKKNRPQLKCRNNNL